MSNPLRLGLVTGATGHIGDRVVAELIDHGWRVRVLSRSAARVRAADWGHRVVPAGSTAGAGEVEVVEGDAGDPADVAGRSTASRSPGTCCTR